MPHGKRPPSLNPLHSFMDNLEDLRVRMSHTGDKPASFSSIEMYGGLIKTSEHGRDCQFALKSLSLFLAVDYDDIKRLIVDLYNQIQEIESIDAFKKYRSS